MERRKYLEGREKLLDEKKFVYGRSSGVWEGGDLGKDLVGNDNPFCFRRAAI